MKRNIRLLTYFNFFTDLRLYAAVAIIYAAQISGSYALGMSIFAITMISSALFEIPTGVFSDRIGRKKTIVWGAVASVLYSIFYAIGQSYWILVVGAVFEGLSRAFYSGNNDAFLHDTLAESGSEHEYEEYLGHVSSMFQIALAVSAVVGSILANWSFPLIMWLSVIPQLLCLCFALQMTEPKTHTQESGNIFAHLKEAYSQFLHNKKLRLLSLSSILGFGLGESGFQFQAAFYASVWPLWAIGLAKMFSSIAAAISFKLSGKLIKKYSGMKIIIANSIYSRVTNAIATAFPTIFSPILMASNSIFFGVSTVAESGLMQREFKTEQRATMGSLNSFAGSIFYGIVSIILGITADKLSPAHAILILQFFQLGNLVLYWRLFKQ